MNVEDTIAAIASPPGGALRGILRLSGPQVLECLRACFCSSAGSSRPSWLGNSADQTSVAPPRAACVEPGTLRAGGLELPCELYFWPGPRSFTRQCVAEIHTVGSPPLLDAALAALCAAGARLAQPGEFTLRAFLAGRIDLTQAEAVLGVIDARSRQQLATALGQLAGGLAQPLHELRSQLLDLLADVEAGLDFGDEDLEFIAQDELAERLGQIAERLARLAEQLEFRGHWPAAFRVALVGWPNVGKSSLMNALAGQHTAIVSEVAGTTRDYLVRQVNILGLDCLLIDTAGFDPDPSAGLAAAAQALTGEQSREAHLQLWCIDATRDLNAWERTALEQSPATERLLVLTKADQLVSTDMHLPALLTSSRTGRGLEELRQAICRRLEERMPAEAAVVAGTALRCGESLRGAAHSLEHARRQAAAGDGEELIASELRAALDQLAQVVGAVYTDDLLERIFSRFCIGK